MLFLSSPPHISFCTPKTCEKTYLPLSYSFFSLFFIQSTLLFPMSFFFLRISFTPFIFLFLLKIYFILYNSKFYKFKILNLYF